MTLILLAIVALVITLAVTRRLGLSMTDLLEPETDGFEWIAGPDDQDIDFGEALRPYGSARRGE